MLRLNTTQQLRRYVYIIKPHYAFLGFSVAEEINAPIPYCALVDNRELLMDVFFGFNCYALFQEQFNAFRNPCPVFFGVVIWRFRYHRSYRISGGEIAHGSQYPPFA